MILLGMGISSRKRRHMSKMHGAWAAKADGRSFPCVSSPEFQGVFREVLRPPERVGSAEARAAAISFLRRDPYAQFPGAFQEAKVLPLPKEMVSLPTEV